jgi:hypothetical protein
LSFFREAGSFGLFAFSDFRGFSAFGLVAFFGLSASVGSADGSFTGAAEGAASGVTGRLAGVGGRSTARGDGLDRGGALRTALVAGTVLAELGT